MSAIDRIQPPFGRLTWDAELEWWLGGPLTLPLLEGQTAQVQIALDTGGPTAPFPDDLIEAANRLLALPPAAKDAVTPHVWANYLRMRTEVGDDVPDIAERDIWRHVAPAYVTFDRRTEDGLVYASIECECAWEAEHGLQLVLQRGVRWVKVSDVNGHLTDGHAYAAPSLDVWMSDPAATLPLRTFEEVRAIAEKDRRRQ
jgi:hypothetical protein